MTEVVATSSQQRHHSAASTGPLTRSAMAARSPSGPAPTVAATARQHGSETSPTAAPLSSSAAAGPPHPEPAAGERETHQQQQPRRSITKKRAASINTEEANRPKLENLSLSTPGSASAGLICLCTPAPKVPRPRNAFILYRQHHQAQVVQQNPGLANPEISKIIGEQWRNEPEERKNQWKQLAEEEKQHHQRQYPDYRYQPRRGNKGGGSQSTRPAAAPGEDPHRCPNCGGRYIATPRTPATPFMTPTAPKPGSTPYGQPQGHHPLGSSRSEMSRLGRAHPTPQWAGGPQSAAASLYDIREDYDNAMSPNDAKRRRYTAAGGSYHNFHSLPSPPPAFPGHHPAPHPRQPSLSNPTTPAANYTPAVSLPGPSTMLPRTSPGPMPPPPRPVHSVSVSVSGQGIPTTAHYPPPPHPHNTHLLRNNNNNLNPNLNPNLHGTQAATTAAVVDFDESLRLPPLQTHLPTTATSPDNNSEGPSATAGAASGVGAVGLGIQMHPTPTTIIPSYGGGVTAAAAGVMKRDERDVQARSVEAMVMSISFVSKLRVLERISPPLPTAVTGGTGSVSGGERGPVIAVEGPDARLVRAVAGVVGRALRGASPAGEGGWEVRCWEDGNMLQQQQQQQKRGSVGGGGGGEDVVMGEAAGGRVSRQGSQGSVAAAAAASVANINPFTAYLSTISDWHAKSAEIVKFVTRGMSSSSSTAATPTRETRLSTSSATTTASSTSSTSSASGSSMSTTTDPNRTEPESDATPRPSTTTTTTRHPLPTTPGGTTLNTAATTGTTTTTTTHKTKAHHNNRLPIALLPSGFSLTLADRFACAVPIADAYAPVDHWQWMATLWRGIVGADLVIYVCPRAGSSGAGEEGGMGGGGGGTVDVKSGGLIVVRVPVAVSGVGSVSGAEYGDGGAGDREVVVDEKMERRLGFEVVEWVRGGGWINAGRGVEGGMGMGY